MGLAVLLATATPDATASEQPLLFRFSLDPYLSLESGADFTTSSMSAAAWGEEMLFGPIEGRVTGVTARAARTILLDAPISFWFAILQHEAFGHNGRAREFGSSAGVRMGDPWGYGNDSYASFDAEGLSNLDLLRIYAGGCESNGLTATMLERQMVAGRPMRGLDLLFGAWNRYCTSTYVLRNTPDPEDDPAGFYREWNSGGDVAKYLGHLNIRFFGDSGITPTGVDDSVVEEWERMEKQAVWNLLDPGLWLSLWTVGQRVGRGDEAAAVPLPTIGGRRVLPVVSADWLPDGPTASLEMVFGARSDAGVRGGSLAPAGWFSVVARRGEGPAGAFVALGAATEMLWQTPRWRVGGDVEAWSDPRGGVGGGGRLRFRLNDGQYQGFSFDIGVKSDGHWPGRPANVGPFVALGFDFEI